MMDNAISYNNLFARGFVVQAEPLVSDYIKTWSYEAVGSFHFYFHKQTQFSRQKSKINDFEMVFVGLPIDINNTHATSTEIANNCIEIFDREGPDGLLKYIAYLGGRFVAFILQKDLIQAIPDCHATYACYFSTVGKFIAASHSNLIAKIKQYQPGKAAAMLNHPDYNEPGGKYFPALLTPYDEVKQLFPNCKLTYDSFDNNIKHERFYPLSFSNCSPENTVDESYKLFEDAFCKHLHGLTVGRQFYLSLTGGLDSRVTLAGLSRLKALNACTAFTYYRPENPTNESINDAFIASKISSDLRVPHKLVRLKAIDYGSEFHKMYSMSFAHGARHPTLARAYYEELPHNILSLVSTCSETGTVFYTHREDTEISAALLAKKFTTSKLQSHPSLIHEFDNYINFVQFTKTNIANLDFYDLFYWEHRNAKWASLWYSEADLAHFTVVPFNQRSIIEALLSLPLSERQNRSILKRFIEHSNF